MFFRRHYEKEMMDDFTIHDDRIDKALSELNIINDLLGGKTVSLKSLKNVIPSDAAGDSVVLDIGAGGSNLFEKLPARFSGLTWIGTDLNFRAVMYDRMHNNSKLLICADAFTLPVKDKSVDIVHASLFLHHFSEEKIIDLLDKFRLVARKAIIINDLRRNLLAFLGIKAVTVLFSRSNMVKNDGPLSVKRGFVLNELKNIISGLGFTHYIIKRRWAFRWQIVIYVS